MKHKMADFMSNREPASTCFPNPPAHQNAARKISRTSQQSSIKRLRIDLDYGKTKLCGKVLEIHLRGDAKLRASELTRAVFGDDVVEHYANGARVELAAFDAAVTDWELRRSFERM